MHKVALKTVLVLSLLILSACARVNLEQDYRPGTEFDPSWHRYDWRGGQSQVSGFERERLQRVAEQALAKQGYERDTENPELLFNISAVTRPATGGNRSVGLSIGLPVGRHGSVGVGGARSLDADRQEGVLILDITHAESRELIWRGSAAGIPMRDFELAREDQLRSALEDLIGQFPPE